MAEVTFRLDAPQVGAINWLAILQALAQNLPTLLSILAGLFPAPGPSPTPQPPH